MPTIDESLDALGAKVENLTTVKDSLKAYLTGLAPILLSAKNAPDKIDAIAAKIQTDADEIAGQIVTNTPAEPTA